MIIILCLSNHSMRQFTLYSSALLLSNGALAAVTSLFIPGFDPQSLSVDVLGVEGDRTTYAVQKGVYTDPSEDESGFTGTATLVEGSDYASFNYVFDVPSTTFTMNYDCALQDGLAICSGVIEGTTYVETETAVPFEVQVGTTAFATATGGSEVPSNTQSSEEVSQTGSSGSENTDNGSYSLVAPMQIVMGAVAVVLGLRVVYV